MVFMVLKKKMCVVLPEELPGAELAEGVAHFHAGREDSARWFYFPQPDAGRKRSQAKAAVG
jgi:hypothetical protein